MADEYCEYPGTYDEGFELVYFIMAGDDLEDHNAVVKIGLSSNLAGRLTALQTGHYQTLTILATQPGDLEIEAWLHRRFAGSHIRGEWFRLTEDIRAYVAALGNRKAA